MKKLLLFISALILTSSLLGQVTVSQYTFSQPAGSWTAISGGTVLGTGTLDDNTYNANPIGFTFTYRGVAYTTFSACANGFIALGSTVYSSYSAISNSSTGVGYQDLVCAVNNDLQGQTTGEMRYQTIGSAPNRTLVMQWLHFGKYSYSGTGAGDDWSFQVRLNETTNTVDIVYGSFIVNANSQTEQVGLRGLSNADYNNRTTTTNWSATTAGASNAATCTLSNTVYPASGLTFRWTPPPPIVISYIPLMNTSSTGSRVLTATITSTIGQTIPTSGIGLPMLYWKKNAGGWTGVQAIWSAGSNYNFTINATPVLGDVISYYIVAQDNAATPNVVANPNTGIGTLTANPPAASSPPTNPSTYTIVAPFCGNKIIGPGGDYTTLTAAVAAYNAVEASCATTFLFNASYTSASETFPIVINYNSGASASNNLTIKPNAGVTVNLSGANAAGPLLKILNSYCTLDGSNAGTTSRNLTMQNTAVGTPQVLVIGSTGTTPIVGTTVKNCIFINGANNSSAVIISDGAAPGTAGYFNNITFQNNNIQLAYIALYSIAQPVAGNGSGLLITGNDINTSGTNSVRLVGVYVQGVDGATVSNNNIGNFNNTIDGTGNMSGIWLATSTVNTTVSGNSITNLTATSAGPRGIAVSSGSATANITVTNNTISTLTESSGSYAVSGIYLFSSTGGCTISRNLISTISNNYSGGYMGCGIYLASTLNPANCTVVNNGIWGVTAYGYSSAYYNYNPNGILVYSGAGYSIYFNTVYMNTNTTVAGYIQNIFLYSGLAAGAVDLRNNIFSNTCTVGTNYNIYSQSAATAFSNMDYNDYWATSGNLGYANGTVCTSLAMMQANFGGNLNSQNINPTFAGTDLHFTNATLLLKGLYMAAVPADLSNNARTSPTDMGCYQIAAYPGISTTAASGVSFTTATLNGSATIANGLVTTTGFDYGLTTTYGSSVAGVPATLSANGTFTGAASGLAMNTTYNYRAKGTNGSAIIYGSNMTFTTAGPPTMVTNAASMVGSSFATLNGTCTANQDNTAVSFDWGLSSTVFTNNIPGTPATIGGTTPTAFSANLTSLIINTTYYFRAKGVNGGGTTYGTVLSFFTTCVTPPPAGPITGPSQVCKNGSGYVFSIDPVNYAYVYIWSLPPGFTITSYPNSNVITVSVSNSATSGSVSVFAQSNCGASGASSSKAVIVNNQPVPTVSGGPSTACQYAAATYTTQTGMNSYIWTVTPDGTINSGQGTSSVSITWTATGSKTVSVNYTDPLTGCTGNAPGTKAVTVNAAPVPTINGQTSMCANSGYYWYTTQTGMTNYTWTISGNGTIQGGQGTSTLMVSWNTPGSGFVTVNYANSNGCYAQYPVQYNVYVNGLPEPAGGISGPSTVCPGTTGAVYMVNPITNATSYVWAVPAGATITSGQGTNTISVDFAQNATSGSITVYGNSMCGNGQISPPFNVTIRQLPDAAGTISGTSSVCEGTTGVGYSVPPINNASDYIWSLPPGATIASGFGTNAITVNFAIGAQSGNITVLGTNSCGSGTVSPNFPVTVNPIPAVPTITVHGDTLFSSASTGNQWWYASYPIIGATDSYYVVKFTGWYWVQVTQNGCVSDTSAHVYMIATGVSEPPSSKFNIYPVPNDGHFTLQMFTANAETFDISVVNALGNQVFARTGVQVNGATDYPVDLRPVPSGVYTIMIRNSEHRVVRKIVINK